MGSLPFLFTYAFYVVAGSAGSPDHLDQGKNMERSEELKAKSVKELRSILKERQVVFKNYLTHSIPLTLLFFAMSRSRTPILYVCLFLPHNQIDSQDCVEKIDLVKKVIASDKMPQANPKKNSGGGRMKTTRAKLAGLNCIVTENAEDDFDAVVVVCHGFGASENDLAPLAGEILPALKSHRIKMVFPQAPVDLGGGSYAWWPLDLQKVFF